MTSTSLPRAQVALTTLGCKVNRADTEAIVANLASSGIAAVSDMGSADAVLVNTCCVTQEAEKKVRKAVRRALRECDGPVYVTGCLATVDGSGLSALDERVAVVEHSAQVADRIADGLPQVASAVWPDPAQATRTRVAIKVEDGCDHFCSYCIVPTARGNPRSESLDDVRRRLDSLVAGGTAEVVLTGVNLGLWRDGDKRLGDLVRSVAESGIHRVRLSSIEPLHVDDHLLEALASTPAVCPHLHIPLQSGSDDVLEAMGRGYDADWYAARVRAACEALPGLAVTTDVMSGFPGETSADHDATRALVEDLSDVMRKLHVFRFSARPGTRAADMTGTVPRQVAEQRAGELRTLGEDLQRAHVAEAVGSVIEVLVERVDEHRAEGTTPDYLKARIERPGLVEGEPLAVTATGHDGLVVVCA